MPILFVLALIFFFFFPNQKPKEEGERLWMGSVVIRKVEDPKYDSARLTKAETSHVTFINVLAQFPRK